MTVREGVEEWLDLYVGSARAKRNAIDIRSRCERFLFEFAGHIPLVKLSPRDIRRYRSHLERQEFKPETVKHFLSDLRCFLYWASGDEGDLLEVNPWPRKRIMPKVPKRRPDRLTDEEVDALFWLEEPYGFVLRLGLLTGLRWSEMCLAMRGHVQGEELVVEAPKTGEVRWVPLCPSLLWEIGQRPEKLTPFACRSTSSFNRAVQRRSGIQSFHVHRLRHTMACLWLDDGGSIETLREILGHSSITTTERYGMVSKKRRLEEAKSLVARKLD